MENLNQIIQEKDSQAFRGHLRPRPCSAFSMGSQGSQASRIQMKGVYKRSCLDSIHVRTHGVEATSSLP